MIPPVEVVMIARFVTVVKHIVIRCPAIHDGTNRNVQRAII
jgi:hypothetical protein